MNALLLTTEQAAALESANTGSTRTIVPRELAEGRLILNADVLDDPIFADPAKAWSPALLAAERVTLTDADLSDSAQ
jgi:hypothetical protein